MLHRYSLEVELEVLEFEAAAIIIYHLELYIHKDAIKTSGTMIIKR
jgi:hypothetical protein